MMIMGNGETARHDTLNSQLSTQKRFHFLLSLFCSLFSWLESLFLFTYQLLLLSILYFLCILHYSCTHLISASSPPLKNYYTYSRYHAHHRHHTIKKASYYPGLMLRSKSLLLLCSFLWFFLPSLSTFLFLFLFSIPTSCQMGEILDARDKRSHSKKESFRLKNLKVVSVMQYTSISRSLSVTSSFTASNNF